MTLPNRSHSYREFIDPSEPMYISDRDILAKLVEFEHASPGELSQQRFRENVIRLQLRDLNRIGLVQSLSHDTYEMTDFGRSVSEGEESLPSKDGLFMVAEIDDRTFPDSNWHLNDFSNLDGETIIAVNFDIIDDSAEEYGWIQDSPEKTRHKIGNVSETDLNRIMREFPTHEPIPQQSAHWVRAIAGLHFFPDANHRTAMNTLSVLYRTLMDGPLPIGDNIGRVVLESKIARVLLTDVRFDTLWKRDALYQVWHRYFRRVLCGDGDKRHEPPEHKLRLILNYAREIL
ncbi:hypothetical protein HTSR_1565 [Halodesulfurarchaeum formicicum]|uniref:Fido domain-containing protein n=2 Tax=Halodesulfurarchaeum formicicum TaxID=1873524 RepID=A0A1D8S5U8_9EURY|nr:hypothetical protein HTSR_1565 [Halodesulfurarchaeum formicicum]